MFLLAFIAIAETIYWTSRKEYLEAKAKYLRELIGTKNDLDSPSKPFSSCVYEKWESGEMDLLEAASVCELKY
tara:strand:+ start:638 stop:856 length:219 start_codon:yes stop_codon:yes gene_type:complete